MFQNRNTQDTEKQAQKTPEQLLTPPASLWRTTLKRFRRRLSGRLGLAIVAFVFFVAIFAPVLAPYSPTEQLIGKENVKIREKPCVHLLGCPADKPQHWMGLDGNGRDNLSRIIYGAQISLMVGFFTVGISLFLGVLLGAIAGYWGGWLDNIIMRIMDVILGFPYLLLAIALVSISETRSIQNAMLAIAIVTMPSYARVIRASVLSVKEMDYVAASRALGASKLRILLTRVLPNAITPLIVLASMNVAGAILDAAALSFLGMGAQEPMPEWGQMLSRERAQVLSAPHGIFFPGLAIMLTTLGFTLLGDGLRDALDPQLND
jgi:ABC-type dipeptide/oligopeptide/nickel transport system permease subunit